MTETHETRIEEICHHLSKHPPVLAFQQERTRIVAVHRNNVSFDAVQERAQPDALGVLAWTTYDTTTIARASFQPMHVFTTLRVHDVIRALDREREFGTKPQRQGPNP